MALNPFLILGGNLNETWMFLNAILIWQFQIFNFLSKIKFSSNRTKSSQCFFICDLNETYDIEPFLWITHEINSKMTKERLLFEIQNLDHGWTWCAFFFEVTWIPRNPRGWTFQTQYALPLKILVQFNKFEPLELMTPNNHLNEYFHHNENKKWENQ